MPNSFCGQCGHPALGPYCGNCGLRIDPLGSPPVAAPSRAHDKVDEQLTQGPDETTIHPSADRVHPPVVPHLPTTSEPNARNVPRRVVLSGVLLTVLIALAFWAATDNRVLGRLTGDPDVRASAGAATTAETADAPSDSSTETPRSDASATPEQPAPTTPTVFDPVQLGLCPQECRESGSMEFQHPGWGTVTLRAFAPETPPGTAGVAVVSSTGETLWHLPASQAEQPQYEWSITTAAVDTDGLIFLTYNPGRYDGVAVLRPSQAGMDVLAWPYDVPGSQSFYNAQIDGPDQGGRHAIIQWTQDCNPSCATGQLTAERLTWDGTRFSPAQSPLDVLVLTGSRIGTVSLPMNAESTKSALVSMFGREPDDDRSFSGCMAEVAGPDYAVTRVISWGDFSVMGDGRTSESLDITAWLVKGPDLPVPMTTYGGFHLGDDIFDLARKPGGFYDEMFHFVTLDTGIYYYGDDANKIDAAGTLGGCD